MSDARGYNPKTLAFMGDAVYEALVREKLILEGEKPVGELHKASASIVCAGAQSEIYEFLASILTEAEYNILKRGRNSNTVHVPKSADAVDYRRATGIEALFGYLYLSGENGRIKELFEKIWEEIRKKKE